MQILIMESALKPFVFHSQIIIILLTSSFFLPSSQSNSDFTTLVYTNCTPSQHNGSSRTYAATLSSFFEQLVTQSFNSNFYKTTLTDDHVGGISGFFQCRGDLSRDNCNLCIKKIPQFSRTLCNEAAVAARIQLSGCYAHFNTDESLMNIASKHDLLHKICGEPEKIFDGFEEMRDAGFATLESGVVEATHGYYKTYYESMELEAQCQEDLEHWDCGECVSNAGKIARDECGLSVYGQVYLKKCFISYHYYPEGIPKDFKPEDQVGNGKGKKVAIAVGVAAALVVGLIFLKFLKSCGKKDDDY